MVEIAPFRGLRYDVTVAGPPLATSAPAYEDVEAVDYAVHRAANPYTILELIAPRAGGYAAAGDTLKRWLRTGVLRAEPEPVLYRYEQHELRGSSPALQRGVLVSARLERLGGAVLPHERVDAARLEARRRRLQAVPVDLSPVFALATEPMPDLSALLDRRPPSPPVLALTDEQGVDHRIWALTDPGLQQAVAAALRPARVMIADGHHRYAAALAAGASHTLMYVVDPYRHGPRVRAIHRVVEGASADVLERLERDFVVAPTPTEPAALARSLESADALTYGLCLPGPRSYTLRPRDAVGLERRLPKERSETWRRLDAAVLECAVLPELGAEPRVHYRHDAAAAASGLGSGDALFLLRPADVRTVLTLALSGELLPPKTTSFAPKPRTGLVLRLLDD